MRSPCDAEDVVQDVFVSLMRSAKRFEDEGHLKAWLITAAINRCRSLARAPWAKRVPLDEELAERKLRYGPTRTPPTTSRGSIRFGRPSIIFPTT